MSERSITCEQCRTGISVALGVGLLVIAWKDGRVPGLIPVTVALVACLLLTSVVDVARGQTAALATTLRGPGA